MDIENKKEFPPLEIDRFGEPIVTAEHIYGIGNVCVNCFSAEIDYSFNNNFYLSGFCSKECADIYWRL